MCSTAMVPPRWWLQLIVIAGVVVKLAEMVAVGPAVQVVPVAPSGTVWVGKAIEELALSQVPETVSPDVNVFGGMVTRHSAPSSAKATTPKRPLCGIFSWLVMPSPDRQTCHPFVAES